MIDAFLQRIWYGRSPLALMFLPLSWLFASVAATRRAMFHFGILRTVRVAKPVIIVGNITVGGTGKTPFVIWLTETLRARGWVPGVITRGYRGSARTWPREVTATSNAAEFGDEAVLLAERTGSIVVAGPDRVRAAERAIELGATVIISDDGLQHYRLARNFEIAIVDDARRFGNTFRLPAGPLRESPQRLLTVDAVVRNCRGAQSMATPLGHRLELTMRTLLVTARSLVTGEERPLRTFIGQPVHAVAGIGNPTAFFDALRNMGLQVREHAFADHAVLGRPDLQFADSAPVLMTEKDAVKCRTFADARCWAVPLDVVVDQPARIVDALAHMLDRAR
jgi:tetraacyldisaccharide 4'-kinase